MKRAAQLGRERSAGILMHVSSLPGPFGIGDFGPAATDWIDALANARQRWWQVLPLGPAGAGNSPYQCFSAFAGNPAFISPELLAQAGLLAPADYRNADFPVGRVHYARALSFKWRLLARAWQNFRAGAARSLRASFKQFRTRHSDWLDDFALFMAMKQSRPNQSWTMWPRDVIQRSQSALRDAARNLGEAIDRHQFEQFIFFQQLESVRAHARSRGIGMIGDLPMFVSAESADVWAEPEQFLLDRHGRPTCVAGVPPDYFSKTGQRWGNPLYNWRAMRRDGFQWWTRRVRAALEQADAVRIDHFRGLDACWEIPAAAKTARRGRWANAPGAELLSKLRDELGALPLIAEDLGLITPQVEKLRDQFGLPGMRVLQFAFGGGSDSPFLPHRHVPNAVAYTGTHDNDTTVGWFRHLTARERQNLEDYAPEARKDAAWAMIRLAWSSVAQTAIAPVQDILGLGSHARMNLPGSPTGNWTWRLARSLKDEPEVIERLAAFTVTYGRAG